MLNTSLSSQEVVNSFRCIIYPYIFFIATDMLLCYYVIMLLCYYVIMLC